VDAIKQNANGQLLSKLCDIKGREINN